MRTGEMAQIAGNRTLMTKKLKACDVPEMAADFSPRCSYKNVAKVFGTFFFK